MIDLLSNLCVSPYHGLISVMVSITDTLDSIDIYSENNEDITVSTSTGSKSALISRNIVIPVRKDWYDRSALVKNERREWAMDEETRLSRYLITCSFDAE